jgi:cytochrome P450
VAHGTNRPDGVRSVEEAGLAFVDPDAYADGRLEEACKILRREAPVHWVESDDFRPFFVLSKHADVHHVETRGDVFLAGPRYRLYRKTEEPVPGEGVRTLVRMDRPEHTDYRRVASKWFHPNNLERFDATVRVQAKLAVDRMMERNGASYDFVRDIAMHFPLTVISEMLGVPESDRELLLAMAMTGFGGEDPEYLQYIEELDLPDYRSDFVPYFLKVRDDRLAHPTDDISTTLAQAKLHGEPLPVPELLGYFGILATAGHDTTAAAIAGGIRAFIENPDQIARLQAEPTLVPLAAEEMIRWTTPVKSFMRVAIEETEIRGQKIAANDSVLLAYPSANFDEDVFEDPYRFDIGRDPNRHLAFGHGIHFCLGAQLARMEIRAFLAELGPRLQEIHLAGDPQLIKTLFVGGLKHLRITAEVS